MGTGWNYIELWFSDTSTLVGHFESSPRERKKRDRRNSRDEREEQERKKNESEESEETKTFPSTLIYYKDSRHFAQLLANLSWMTQWHKKHDIFTIPDHPRLELCKFINWFYSL